MQVIFLNPHLQELYISGKSKKYKSITGNILKKYFTAIAHFESAHVITDLWNAPSLKFEKLQGYEKRYSVRLDRKWRLEVEIEWENEEKTIGIIGIDEISNHYGG